MIRGLIAKLDKRILSIQVSQMFRVGIAFVISIFFAKFYQDTRTISTYESLILLGSGLTFFWVSGLMTAFIPYFNSLKQVQNKLIFNTFIILVILSFLSSMAFYMLAKNYYVMDSSIIRNFSLFLFFNTPAFFIEYIFLIRKKNRLIILYSVLVFILHISAVFFPVYFYNDFSLAIICLKYYGLIKFILLLILIFNNGSIDFDRGLIKGFLVKASPVILSILVGGGVEYIDGFIVRFFSSDHEFALFRYGARELPLAMILANSLSLVISGEISRNVDQKQQVDVQLRKLKASVSRLSGFLFPITLLLLVFSERLFGFVYNDIFVDASIVFDIYLLLLISRMLFTHTIILGYQKTNLIFYASAIELLLNVILSITLIMFIGIIGVAIATLLSNMIYKLLFIRKIRKMGYHLSQIVPGRIYLFSGILLAVFIIKLLI